MLATLLRVLRCGVIVSAVTFTPGFVGPIIFTPEANQGPLLGIFITGPIGFWLGIGGGIWREVRRTRSGATNAGSPQAPS
jgi:hypothetical protein